MDPKRKRIVVIVEIANTIEVSRFPTRLAAVTFLNATVHDRPDCLRASIAEEGRIVYTFDRADDSEAR